MTRPEIIRAIQDKRKQIIILNAEILGLKKQGLLLCDKHQWFTEKKEDVQISKRPKKFEKKLIGRIHWNENFTDEATGEVITIERSELVRVNGEWL
jgi:hypothetical protein